VKRRRTRAVFFALAGSVTLAACTSGGSGAAAPPGHWARYRHVPGVVDLAGPRGDGSFTVAAAGRLFILNASGALTPFAQGPGGYATVTGGEPYITLAGRGRVAGTRCSFPHGMIFALQPGSRPGIAGISAAGLARRFAALPGTEAPTGITFDSVGDFGHKLLVTARNHAQTAVLAIDCTGRVQAITTHAPAMEGGITVAPPSFGRYGGDLIAPGETSGRIFAISPDGTVTTLAASGLPRGGDIGVESTGFVPPGFRSSGSAFLADRYSKGNKHPGTDSILRLPGAALVKSGVRAGDLLVATEASAHTIVIRCASSCTVRHIADGPAITHAEGHIVFGQPSSP
jgi:hypothetical protein